jgi:hypothetical protein
MVKSTRPTMNVITCSPHGILSDQLLIAPDIFDIPDKMCMETTPAITERRNRIHDAIKKPLNLLSAFPAQFCENVREMPRIPEDRVITVEMQSLTRP